ncbi:MAG: N-acetylglucosaminyldiphosphoundecaprenol N-acetyl-beta-D-mannosaminyltransferase [Rhodothermales bacterium]|jgi:N-acetylglucosaminyldiphosphoundecaprenol N-acetyl-beta-D-mannosaminyltransferase
MRYRTAPVISFPVAALNYERAVAAAMRDAEASLGGYVCIANVHMVMEAFDDPEFREVVAGARMVTSDGMPLVWMLRAQGLKEAERVYGPTLTLHVCRAAAAKRMPVGLYGGTEQSILEFKAFLASNFPTLEVACAISPPFRPPTQAEDRAHVREIMSSGARILFVGIGCPKQEKWMGAHAESLPGVTMFGVGAAFDFHSGRVRQAPAVLQKAGLEWAFRLLMEPKRLWRRYFVHNPRFVYLAIRQLLRREPGQVGRSHESGDRSPRRISRRISARKWRQRES